MIISDDSLSLNMLWAKDAKFEMKEVLTTFIAEPLFSYYCHTEVV